MTRIARCCCRDCEVVVEGDPSVNGVCHCQSCKRRSGSAFGWSAYFGNEQVVSVKGELQIYDVPGRDTQRYFCARCGTTLFWKSDPWPTVTGFAGGCFEDPALPEPTFVAEAEQRCPWVTLPDTWGVLPSTT